MMDFGDDEEMFMPTAVERKRMKAAKSYWRNLAFHPRFPSGRASWGADNKTKDCKG